jgi:KilA-N domain
MANDSPQFPLVFVPHKYEGRVVEQRVKDGYINATAMCQAAGKQFNDYSRNATTKAFLEELASETGIPVSGIVQSVKGGPPERQGTWVHPQVAIHLGQWLSARFAVQVSKWVYDWMSGPQKPRGPSLPYHLRRYVSNQRNVPEGHFSVLNEITLALIGPLEAEGYTLPESLWPDISQGLMFARWLREEKHIAGNLPDYVHEFEDGREPVLARGYPNELLPDFRKHFSEVWLRYRARKYFSERDPKALGYLPKLLPPKPTPKKLMRLRRVA